MLASLLLVFADEYTWLNIFRYLTFRGILAVLTSLGIGVALYPYIIRKLKEMSIGEVTRDDDVPLHSKKGRHAYHGRRDHIARNYCQYLALG